MALGERLQQLHERHEQLKKRIHAFRMPIQSRFGLFGVGVVYFTIPLVAGYFIFQWSNGIRETNLGPQRERLLEAKKKWESQGDKPKVVMAKTPKPRKIDAPPAKEL